MQVTEVDRFREMESQQRIQAAFPWASRLTTDERAQFARQLAEHPRGVTDRELDRLLGRWRALAEERARRSRRAA